MVDDNPTTPEEWWPKSDWGGAVIGRAWKASEEMYRLGADVKITMSRPEGGPRISVSFEHYDREDD